MMYSQFNLPGKNILFVNSMKGVYGTGEAINLTYYLNKDPVPG